jgi:hypothetical protein
MGEVLSIPLQQATLKVSAEAFNVIIAGLKQLPYIVSQPVIDQLRQQVKTQLGETDALER